MWLIRAAGAMLITVYCICHDLKEITFSLEINLDLRLIDSHALCKLESSFPAAESLLSMRGSRQTMTSEGL